MIADLEVYALFLECHRRFRYEDGVLVYKAPPSKRNHIGDIVGYLGDHYVQVKVKGKMMRLHRVIFFMFYGYAPEEVDHKDGNKLNNRIDNLRAATKTQNRRNVGLIRTNNSGVKGVHWNKMAKKWQAQCRVSGKNKFLGYFSDLAEAGQAAKSFREQHQGDFANHGEIIAAAREVK